MSAVLFNNRCLYLFSVMAAPLPGKAKKKRSKTKPAGHGTQETRSATTTVAEATAVATAVAAVVAAPIKGIIRIVTLYDH